MIEFETSKGARIYQLPLREFPGLVGNVYLVFTGKYCVLIDTGSGFGDSNIDLERGFEEVGDIRKEVCDFNHLSHVFITHGHIDHYGGLSQIKSISNPKICIHELDRRIVSNHEERLSLAAHRLDEFLTEAGVPSEERERHLEMYKITKSVFQSVPVDIPYESAGMKIGPFRFIHVPGHCAGHVLIQLNDVLFTGDHILEKTSPHQAPEQITLSTGLATYLHSLDAIQPLEKQIKFGLGGHERPIYDLNQRVLEIKKIHSDRLRLIINLLSTPHTIVEISKSLFGKVEGYTILLALEEAGAHVEYLYQRGYLEIVNLKDIEDNKSLNPIYYHCIDNRINNII